jgi:hypothetical protein
MLLTCCAITWVAKNATNEASAIMTKSGCQGDATVDSDSTQQ